MPLPGSRPLAVLLPVGAPWLVPLPKLLAVALRMGVPRLVSLPPLAVRLWMGVRWLVPLPRPLAVLLGMGVVLVPCRLSRFRGPLGLAECLQQALMPLVVSSEVA